MYWKSKNILEISCDIYLEVKSTFKPFLQLSSNLKSLFSQKGPNQRFALCSFLCPACFKLNLQSFEILFWDIYWDNKLGNMSPLRSNFQAISLGNTWELVAKRRILRINHFYQEISLELWFMVANMEVVFLIQLSTLFF